MRLDELVADLPGAAVRGGGNAEIASVTVDSREVTPGCLFAALPGTKRDGADFVPEALRRGAAAVLTPRPIGGLAVDQVISADAAATLGRMAHRLFGDPTQHLRLVGVTGTNGKTTVAFLLRHLLRQTGLRCGMTGTILDDDGMVELPAKMTTRDAPAFARSLAAMVANGCDAAVSEISSHALAQGRVDGASFAAGVFTNLSRDHLDYHGDMDAYFAAKARLFEGLAGEAPAVLNAQDPYCERMAAAAGGPVCRYAVGESSDADLCAIIRSGDLQGTDLFLFYRGRRVPIRLPVVGHHNVQNVLAAVLAALELGADLEDVGRALVSFPGVPGRLERFDAAQGFSVFVDYAHTDDALARVMAVLKPLTRGRLHVVFGCGGDRDRGKRPLMARAAEDAADRVVVTSDNPRTEDPDAIFADIRTGFTSPGTVEWVPDRAEAIAHAIRTAASGDAVLFAGKGHEDYQDLATGRVHLDDRELVRDALRDARGGAR
jgi:UDP-N-acetylmuramoyl-L-alanyl-D-glutamate--2,6-diaminopimelate ligase